MSKVFSHTRDRRIDRSFCYWLLQLFLGHSEWSVEQKCYTQHGNEQQNEDGLQMDFFAEHNQEEHNNALRNHCGEEVDR